MSEPAPSSQSEAKVELTIRAVVLGLILSVVMGAANVYVGLEGGDDGFRLDPGGRDGDAAVSTSV